MKRHRSPLSPPSSFNTQPWHEADTFNNCGSTSFVALHTSQSLLLRHTQRFCFIRTIILQV